MRPFFQDLSDPKQEHDGACSTEVLPQYRHPNCSGIQNRHLDLTVKECIDSLPDIFQGSSCCINGIQRIWQK